MIEDKVKKPRGRPRKVSAPKAPVEAVKQKEGKFLVVESLVASPISFRNPDSLHKGLEDLNLAGFDTEVIEDYWLDVAWFVRQLNEGNIKVYRVDAPPPKRDLSVDPKLKLDDRLMEAQAMAVISNPFYSEISKALINIEPRNADNLVDRDWLKNNGLVFIKNIMAREQKWRKRADLLADCKKRIQYISDL
jgi:hypothetical protein